MKHIAAELVKIAKELNAMSSIYRKTILKNLKHFSRSDIDPRHIEAWMIDELGTLDYLSKSKFQAEVRACIGLVDEDPRLSEELARSHGL